MKIETNRLARAFALTALALAWLPAPDEAAADRPNIIFLLTDDQRQDALGAAGNRTILTPNLDDLAREGVLFANNFCTTSICAVSRATFLTGQYSRRHGVNDFRTGLSDEAFERSYPGRLRAAGYRTAFVGKYGIGRELPEDKYDYFDGFAGQGKYFHEENGETRHLTDMIGEKAEKFLTETPRGEPFCLSVSFKAPHVKDGDPNPFQFDPKYDHLYDGIEIPSPPTATEELFEALPEFSQTSEGRRRWGQRFATPEMNQKSLKGYYRLITGVDRQIGRIREVLEKTGAAENTVMVFTSDNGFFLGERGLAGKWLMYEESIRTPLVYYDPRAPHTERGLRRTEMTLSTDVAPTILEVAGLPIPEDMDGRSVLGLIRGHGRADWRREWYYDHLYNHGGRIPATEGVRGERWKYTRYLDSDPLFEELFDLREDPLEVTNLAVDPAHADRLAEMRKRCDNLRESIPTPAPKDAE